MTPREVLNKAIEESGRATMKAWYNEVYLYSEHWKNLRGRKLKKAKYRCEHCPTKKRLQVHHENYREIFNVTCADLKVFCQYCHAKEHFGAADPRGQRPPQTHKQPPRPKPQKKQQRKDWSRLRAENRLRKALRAGFKSWPLYRAHRKLKRQSRREAELLYEQEAAMKKITEAQLGDGLAERRWLSESVRQ